LRVYFNDSLCFASLSGVSGLRRIV
jgi:hypothetical protein